MVTIISDAIRATLPHHSLPRFKLEPKVSIPCLILEDLHKGVIVSHCLVIASARMAWWTRNDLTIRPRSDVPYAGGVLLLSLMLVG